MVELLDEKHLDCSQGEVIASLINLKQGKFSRQWPHAFNDVSLALRVWEQDEEESKDWTFIKIGVFQSDDTEPSKRKMVIKFFLVVVIIGLRNIVIFIFPMFAGTEKSCVGDGDRLSCG